LPKVQLYVSPGGYFAERWADGSSMPPLGLLSIGAVLEREKIPVEIVPCNVLGLGWKDITRKIRADRPDIVGVTITTENRFQAFKLIRLAKRAHPGCLTILGGPHASMAAEDCIRHIPQLDVVVRGEGEMTMLDICRAWDAAPSLASLDDISGLVLRKNGEPFGNPPRMPIADLDTLPFPAYHLVPFEKYRFAFDVPGHGSLPAVNIMTSRGCPFACSFCATPINWGRHVRMRSPENVVREIELLKARYGIKVVFFFDDTFNANPKRADAICDLMLERKLGVFFKCDVRLDIMSRALLLRMKAAGLFHLSYGLEAGSDRVREDIVGKKIEMADFHNLTAWCIELGVVANVFFIFSHPTETWDEAQVQGQDRGLGGHPPHLPRHPARGARQGHRLSAARLHLDAPLPERRHHPAHGPGRRTALPRQADLGPGQRACAALVVQRQTDVAPEEGPASPAPSPLARRPQAAFDHGTGLFEAETGRPPEFPDTYIIPIAPPCS
jgi:anaerobic magnesium-protoporphyrin IX monomethyl ester cyclase